MRIVLVFLMAAATANAQDAFDVAPAPAPVDPAPVPDAPRERPENQLPLLTLCGGAGASLVGAAACSGFTLAWYLALDAGVRGPGSDIGLPLAAITTPLVVVPLGIALATHEDRVLHGETEQLALPSCGDLGVPVVVAVLIVPFSVASFVAGAVLIGQNVPSGLPQYSVASAAGGLAVAIAGSIGTWVQSSALWFERTDEVTPAAPQPTAPLPALPPSPRIVRPRAQRF